MKASAFFVFRKESVMENRLYRHKWPFLFAPEHSSVQAESPTCTVFARCDGCPYPAHGFICWGGDGDCIRSITEKMNKRQEEK